MDNDQEKIEQVKKEQESKQQEEMAANAQALMKYSQALMAEALGSCQMEAFQQVQLAIPDAISRASSLPQLTQDEVWQQIAHMYDAQSQLFSGDTSQAPVDIDTDSTVQAGAVAPVSSTTQVDPAVQKGVEASQHVAASETTDSQLDDISKMLGI